MAHKLKKKIIELYTNPDVPGSFSGVTKFRNANFPEVPLSTVNKALESVDAFTRHKSYKRKFTRHKTQTYGINKQWQVDLIDMRLWKRKNDGYSYILTAIDIFSRYAYAQPVKTKGSEHMIDAFKAMLQNGKPRFLQSDKGTEFLSSEFQTFLRKINILYFNGENDDVKCSLVERLNRTLQDKIWRIFTLQGTHRWVDILQRVVKSYNNTVHSKLKVTPAQVSTHNSDSLHYEMYDKIPKKDILKNWKQSRANYKTIKINDKVRILESKITFNRGYEPNWSEEIYVVYKINSKGYYIKDLQGEVIKGRFYREELQKVTTHGSKQYAVEKILDYRGTGKKKQALVKWKGYSDKFNLWEPYNAIKDVVPFNAT